MPAEAAKLPEVRVAYYGLDKTESFDDFKKKYMKAAEIIPLMEIVISEGIKKYTDKEVKAIAMRTNEIANKHVSNESKWSGDIVVDNTAERFGKLWSCDILTSSKTAPHIILHEQLHAHSIPVKAKNYEDFKRQYEKIWNYEKVE